MLLSRKKSKTANVMRDQQVQKRKYLPLIDIMANTRPFLGAGTVSRFQFPSSRKQSSFLLSTSQTMFDYSTTDNFLFLVKNSLKSCEDGNSERLLCKSLLPLA